MIRFMPYRDIKGISHINIVVNDIELATEFYSTVLGFIVAKNDAGPMDYHGVDLDTFARNAGFNDGKVNVDVRFLRHPEVGIYMELMHYHFPEGSQQIQLKQINDLGGVRHIALNVTNAQEGYEFIQLQKKNWAKRGLNLCIVGENHQPETVVPYPYKYFYWTDPWGVQWEMEEGRPVDRVIQGITG